MIFCSPEMKVSLPSFAHLFGIRRQFPGPVPLYWYALHVSMEHLKYHFHKCNGMAYQFGSCQIILLEM